MALRRIAVGLVVLIGCALVSAGVALISVPAALIVTGLYLAGGALFFVDVGGDGA